MTTIKHVNGLQSVLIDRQQVAICDKDKAVMFLLIDLNAIDYYQWLQRFTGQSGSLAHVVDGEDVPAGFGGKSTEAFPPLYWRMTRGPHGD